MAADGVTTFYETPVLQMHDGLIREAVAACLTVTFVSWLASCLQWSPEAVDLACYKPFLLTLSLNISILHCQPMISLLML